MKMIIKTNKLKLCEFNKDLFDNLQKEDYDALKEDITKNGIKTDLHITKSNMVLCGHQRLSIAKELNILELSVKVVDIDETDEQLVKEYIIKDNLLRRHLTTEQKYLLYATLSEVYEVGRGDNLKTSDRDEKGRIISTPEGAEVAHTGRDDVLTKTAKATGVKERTIATARAYKRLIDKSPELKTKKVSEVLNRYEIKGDKVIRKNTRIEIDMNKINPYDDNMFHFSSVFYGDFDKDVICIDPVHGPEDIRQYKDYYPTVTRFCNFYHNDGKEFTLRDYADVQDFPKDYKFVGTSHEIKNQIGEAVSPKMSEYILNKYIKGKTYLELFCGCGGFSIGAHKLKKECKWSNDFNKYSGYSYKLNFPEVEVFIGDVNDINEKEIHKQVGDIDFIMGGPPCQGFSSGGQRLGFKEDSRNQLYLEYLRFVKEFKPKQFIMENVKGIEEYKEEIIKDFEKIGYDVKVEKVNGLDIGMKQKRIRVFFIGNLK